MINNSFFVKFRHIHFVGIGGIGISALAKLCQTKGVFVSGSDKTKSDITDELMHLGIDIKIGHNKQNVQNANLVVYTCAVGEDNVEVVSARQRGVPVMERAEFLGELSKEFKQVVAVAGSHGKTTVCSMIGKIFKTAGLNPTILVGGESDGGNLVVGDKDFLVVEACEYKNHFLKLKHDVAVILNIDYDHPDFFASAKEYMAAFENFAGTTTTQNIVAEKYKFFLNDSKCLTYGANGNFIAKNIRQSNGKITFGVFKNQKFYGKYMLNMIGLYNVLNALCAIMVADFYGISKKVQQQALAQFGGIKRRYEYMGKLCGNIVIADYAHHPTQIKNCIECTKKAYKKPVIVVFEPHTYSRTKALFCDFVDSLCLADAIVLLPTYPARERKIKGGTSKDLLLALSKKQVRCKYVSNYQKCYDFLKTTQNSTILLLGAGSIYTLAQQIKRNFLHNQSIC